MSYPKFKYCLLRYVHSELLGEALNVGILFIFPDSGEIIFKYPTNFARVRGAYGSTFSQSVVNGVLKGIAKSVKGINSLYQMPLDLDFIDEGHSVIADRLLLRDATVLRFAEAKTAVVYSSVSKTVEDYYNLFFSHYDENEHVRARHDEEYISKNIKSLLAIKSPEYLRIIRKDVTVNAPLLPEGSFAFDFAWKNQVDHFVKPIGFDFQDSKAINQKAATYYGYLSAISESINGNTVDVLTTRPQIKSLWHAYDKAIEMIDAVKINKTIIEQNKFAVYADEILSHAQIKDGLDISEEDATEAEDNQ